MHASNADSPNSENYLRSFNKCTGIRKSTPNKKERFLKVLQIFILHNSMDTMTKELINKNHLKTAVPFLQRKRCLNQSNSEFVLSWFHLRYHDSRVPCEVLSSWEVCKVSRDW